MENVSPIFASTPKKPKTNTQKSTPINSRNIVNECIDLACDLLYNQDSFIRQADV